MLIVGIWAALLLYIISWISCFFSSNLVHPSGSKFQVWMDVAGMRTAWLIHTITLFGLLWTKAIWPATFVTDILSVAAWGSMVGVQAFPERLPSLFNTSIIRFFVILLLGLSLIISKQQITAGMMVSEQTWFYHGLLGSHIIILLAGDIMLGIACVASIVFLYQEHHLKTKHMSSLKIRFPALGTLDRLSWQGTLWGFFALSIGIMLGILINSDDNSSLANLRFGSSISAWCVFAILLLFRQLQAVRSRWFTIWCVVGFVLALTSLIVEMFRLGI